MEVRHSTQKPPRRRFSLQGFVESLQLPDGLILEAVKIDKSQKPLIAKLRLSTSLKEDEGNFLHVDLIWNEAQSVIELICLAPSLICPEESVDEDDILRTCAGIVNNEWRGATKINITKEDEVCWVLFSITLALPYGSLQSDASRAYLTQLIGHNTALLLAEASVMHEYMSIALDKHLQRVTFH